MIPHRDHQIAQAALVLAAVLIASAALKLIRWAAEGWLAWTFN
jgi:hypothetical protein